MDFDMEKAPAAVSNAVKSLKKKPVLILAIIGALAAVIYLFVRRGSSGAAPAGSSEDYYTTIPEAAAGVTGAAQGVSNAADTTQLYNDVYGLVKQAQDATLMEVDSRIKQAIEPLSGTVGTAVANTELTVQSYKADTLAAMDAVSSSMQSSLGALTDKFNSLNGSVEEMTAEHDKAPATVISAPAPVKAPAPVAKTSVSTTPTVSTKVSTVKKGSTGTGVSTVQSKLNNLGFNSGSVDGVFGKNTEAAVKAFQKAAGITVDGIVGKQTLAALETYQSKKAVASSGNFSGGTSGGRGGAGGGGAF